MTRPARRTILGTAFLVGVAAASIWWVGQPSAVGPAEGTSLLGPATRPTAGDTLRLGTFNIDGGQGLDEQVDLARTAKCLQRLDVIGLQEVHGFSGDPPNQAVPLGGLLHLPYLYVPAERRWGHESFGNAFFTDLTVHAWHRVPIRSAMFHAKRTYLLADLDWRGKPLHVITTHVDFKANGDEQLAAVVSAFLAQPVPAVLMGDLNHPANSPQIQQLLATPGVEEAVGRVLDPVKGRVDWIFLRGLHTVDAGSVDLKASDHPAYWAAVELAGAPAATRPRPPG
jgi:endonuclease/exonuclease/phosphatase family metal-dependent hydrolase